MYEHLRTQNIKSAKNQQIMMKKDCIYISALNVENVKKKLKKLADGKV